MIKCIYQGVAQISKSVDQDEIAYFKLSHLDI